MIIKILLFIINLLLFFISLILFSPFIKNDNIRCYGHKIFGFFWKNLISCFLKDNIVIINNSNLQNEKINIINANHTYQIDLFVINYLFYINKIKTSCFSSFSTNKGISWIDSLLLKSIDACMINSINYKNNISNSIKKWQSKSYNRYVITFFEGITKNDFKGKIKGNVLVPKTVGFYHILDNLSSEINYLTDLNILYTLDGKVLKCKNSDLFSLILKKNVKIYIEINKYKLPKKEDSAKWLKELYIGKDKQINEIKDKYNLI